VEAETAVLAMVATPLAPVALATAGMGRASSATMRGAEWLLDRRDGNKATHENGLHHVLRM
jgi:hypothetical protein